jgi:hypothetical protein
MMLGWLAMATCSAQLSQESGDARPTFGATVIAPFGFCGRIFDV